MPSSINSFCVTAQLIPGLSLTVLELPPKPPPTLSPNCITLTKKFSPTLVLVILQFNVKFSLFFTLLIFITKGDSFLSTSKAVLISADKWYISDFVLSKQILIYLSILTKWSM